jgi:uncharacterized protein YmfQ (DUF2313 family)
MLKDSLPQFVREMKEMSELLKVDQSEINRLLCSIEDMIRQFYISSATYSIDDWEQEFSIEKNSTLTRNQRRAQLLGKLNTRTPATVKMLENLVLKTLGADKVEIREIPQEYRFEIYVQSGYLVENMDIAAAAVYKARPAHLGYAFVNRILRENKKKIYIAAVGKTFKTTEGDVDTNGICIDQGWSKAAGRTFY